MGTHWRALSEPSLMGCSQDFSRVTYLFMSLFIRDKYFPLLHHIGHEIYAQDLLSHCHTLDHMTVT